jgi:hypothetical protein
VTDVPTNGVILSCDEPPLTLAATLADMPGYTPGVGGVEVVVVPGQRPLLKRSGASNPATLTLPLIFDGYADGRSVERDLLTLEQLAGGGSGTALGDLPRIEVDGWPPFPDQRVGGNARWVIPSDPDYGESIRRKQDGHRVRQLVTVTLWLDRDGLTTKRVGPTRSHPGYRYVRVRPGDTFEKIAARELKKKSLGSRLARLNGARSPEVKLKRSTVKVPTGRVLSDWQKGKG